MRFALSEEQIEFSEAVRGLLGDTCGRTHPGRLAKCGTGRRRPRRRQWPCAPGVECARRDGRSGHHRSGKFGGLGMTYEDLSPLLVEAGRVAMPDPLSATAGVAVAALVAAAGSAALSDELHERVARVLEGIAAGSLSVGVLFPAGSSRVARSNNVAGAGTLDAFLAFTGEEVLLIDKSSVELSALESVDGARCLSAGRVERRRRRTLLDGDAAAAANIAAFEQAALGASAELLGLSRTMLEMAVAYATERRQFGVPIGTFQAVKHQLSNASLKVEFCEPLIMRAAHSLTIDDPESSVHVSMAKSKVSAAALEAAATSLQVHGAIGYTVECDLHLFMKRTWALARNTGTASFTDPGCGQVCTSITSGRDPASKRGPDGNRSTPNGSRLPPTAAVRSLAFVLQSELLVGADPQRRHHGHTWLGPRELEST